MVLFLFQCPTFLIIILVSSYDNSLTRTISLFISRYMAPEILSETLSLSSFDAFKQVDMYAFGLVMWEITRRTRINGEFLSKIWI